MHEGAVSAELGLAGWPSVAESLMVERDLALARVRGAARPPPASLRARVRRRPSARARRAGVARERRGEPAPPLRDRRARPHARREREDEPAASHGGRPRRRSSKGSSTARSTASPPTTRRTRGTRRTRRSRRRRSASPGSRRRSPRSTRTSCGPGEVPLGTILERLSAGPARALGLPVPRIAVGEPANLVLLDLEAEWTVERGRLPVALGELVAPRTARSSAPSSRPSPPAGWCTPRDGAATATCCSRTAPSSAAARSPRPASPSARSSSRPG